MQPDWTVRLPNGAHIPYPYPYPSTITSAADAHMRRTVYDGCVLVHSAANSARDARTGAQTCCEKKGNQQRRQYRTDNEHLCIDGQLAVIVLYNI